jgi:hypothetical protein
MDKPEKIEKEMEEVINTYANRKQNDDGTWEQRKEKLDNFKLKNSALPIIYSDLTPEEEHIFRLRKVKFYIWISLMILYICRIFH